MSPRGIRTAGIFPIHFCRERLGLVESKRRKRRQAAFVALTVILASLLVSVGPMSRTSRAGMTWLLETVATGAGTLISIEVDSSGNPWILYQTNLAGGGINLAHWNGSSWSVQRVVNGIGYCLSLALDNLDRPHFVHDFDGTPFPGLMDMHYTYWNGTSWVNETIDSQGDFGGSCSLAFDSLGRPHVSYADYTAMRFDLKYAWRDATSWFNETVDSEGWTGLGNSIALDSLDRPHIAYEERNNVTVMHAWWDGSLWNISVVDSSKQAGLEQTSIGLDSSDGPHIAYLASINIPVAEDRYASWNGSSWQKEAAALIGSVGFGYPVSLRLDAVDRPSIAYRNVSGLSFASKQGISWTTEVVDPGSMVGTSCSLALDIGGNPHIAYVDGSNNLLRYAHRGIDSSTPSSSVDAMVPYWASSPRVITATASDNESRVVNVTLWYRSSTDNASWGSWSPFQVDTSPPWLWLFPFPAGEGYYEFYTTSFDNALNGEPPPFSADAIAGYDATPPVSSAAPIRPYWQATPSIVVNATATDNLSGVADVTLYYSHAPLDNSTWSPWISLGTWSAQPWSWPFSFPDGEGNCRFHTTAGDVAGNIEGSKDYAEAVAGYRIPPDYLPVNPLPSSLVTVGLSLPIQLSIDVLNSGGFENVNATLAFHNESSPSSPFFKVQVPPIPAGSTSGPFTATWTSPATPCTCHVAANVDYYDNVTEWDETNNNYTWTVNVVPGPIATLSIGEPNYTAAETYVTSLTPILMTIVDQSGTGILRTMYSIDGGPWRDYSLTGQFALTGEGEHSVRYYSEDNAGNVEATSTAAIRADNTPPTTVNATGTPKYQSGYLYITPSTAISLTSADGGLTPVGLDVIEYRIDGGQWLSYSSNFTLAGNDGIHTIEYRSRDLLDNSEAVRSLTVFLDDAPPVTTISPATGEFTTDTMFALTSDDSGCGANITKYRIDGGNWIDYIGAFTLPRGVHNVSYYSNDMLNNTERAKWLAVTVSEQPPPSEVEANYKPVVAVMFAIILAVAGAFSSKKRPLTIVKTGKRKFILSWSILAIPFITVEAATGILSLSLEPLRVPPLVGWGTGMDCSVLFAGLLLMLLRLVLRTKEREAVMQSRTRERVQ